MNKTLKKISSVFMVISLIICGTSVGSAKKSAIHAEAGTKTPDRTVIPEGAEYVEGEAIVLYSSGTTKKMAKKSLDKWDSDFEVTDMYQFGYGEKKRQMTSYNRTGTNASGHAFSVGIVKSDTLSTEELVKKLKASDGVETACPNFVFHATAVDTASAESLKNYQWMLSNDGRDGGTAGADIKKEAVNIKDRTEKVIVVIDSGVDYEHEDLRDAMWENPFEKSGLRGKHGFDFVNRDDDPMDDYNHGTHCAGIIAGTGGKGNGIEGVAKDTGSKIMALKVLGSDGAGDTRGICASYDYVYKAATLGVNIVATSNSYGAIADSTMEYIEKRIFDSLGQIGVMTVCAAGNASEKLSSVYLPASVQSEYVVTVAATEQDDCLACYSNYGLDRVDIAAPGTSILSTIAIPGYSPWCYDRDKWEEAVEFYENFDREDCVGKVDVSNSKRMKVEWVPDAGTGAKGEESGCLRIKINAARNGEYMVCLDRYETKQSDSPVYASADIRFEGAQGSANHAYYVDGMQNPDGSLDRNDCDLIDTTLAKEENKSWIKAADKIRASQKAGEEHVLGILVAVAEKGEYTLYVDNVTRSKPELSGETVGKYAFYKGTSMACPVVAGGVALLAAGYPGESALARRNRLMSCVRKTEELEKKVRTGGTLDFTNCDNPVSRLKDARINDDGTLSVDGFALAGTKLLINGKEAVVREQGDEHMEAEAAGYENRAVTLSMEKDGETLDEWTGHLTVGTELCEEPVIRGFALEGEWLHYNEESGVLYCVGGFDVYAGSLEHIEKTYTYTDGVDLTGLGDSTQDFISANVYNIVGTKPVMVDGIIYTLAYVDYYHEEYVVLLRFDEKKGRWSYVCKLPEAFRDAEGVALEEYDGGLYCIGGFDVEKEEAVNNVCRYDLAAGKVTETAPLPEKRAFAKTAVHGGRLYVTLGGGESAGIRNFIYDGDKWSVSKAVIEDEVTAVSYEYSDDGNFPYYDGEVHAVKNGLVYFTNGTDGMSSPFMYDAEEDSFVNMKWCFQGQRENSWTTVDIKDKIYIVCDMDGSYWEMGARVYSIPVERESGTPEGTAAPTQTPVPTVTPNPAATQTPAATGSPDGGKEDTLKKPAKGKIRKATLKKKKLSVAFQKIKNADGYVVQAATDKKFRKNKKTWNTKKLKIGNKKWTKKKCYVRVRAYRKKGSSRLYGVWSNVKKL